MNPTIPVPRRVCTRAENPEEAVREVVEALHGFPLGGLLFFAGGHLHPDRLARAIHSAFSCPVAGCTTAGELFSGPGYLENSLVAVGFPENGYRFRPVLISDLDNPLSPVRGIKAALKEWGPIAPEFALLLVDGLSDREDSLLGTLKYLTGNIPLVGGSAADQLAFQETHVFAEGTFHSHAAVLIFFETQRDTVPFCFQHFQSGSKKLVVTSADSKRRLVYEINGFPAAEVYAAEIGSEVSELEASLFAANPVLLKMGGDEYVRSIQSVQEKTALKFYCAIEEGMVLTLGRPGDLVAHLSDRIQELKSGFEELDLVLGFDCILRKLELQGSKRLHEASACLAGIPFMGFSTFGEQFESVHMNHTLSGIAIGKAT